MIKQQTADPATPHPLAGTMMSGADIVVQVLADENVDTIFGYSGGAILPTYDAVFRYNEEHRRADGTPAIPLIVPANEQGAGFMAAGYARASGKVGVSLGSYLFPFSFCSFWPMGRALPVSLLTFHLPPACAPLPLLDILQGVLSGS